MRSHQCSEVVRTERQTSRARKYEVYQTRKAEVDLTAKNGGDRTRKAEPDRRRKAVEDRMRKAHAGRTIKAQAGWSSLLRTTGQLQESAGYGIQWRRHWFQRIS